MGAILNCPKCQADVPWDSATASATVACPRCGQPVRTPSQLILESGRRLGDFRIDKLVAVGGMGVVYAATQLSMNRKVALKVLPAGVTDSPATVDRFLHEVRLTARFSHPHIVQAYEAGEDGGIHYMAMAYIKGELLAEKIERNGPVPEREALVILRKIASALGYAWDEHQLLHRDVKPANIIIDPSGEPKLMDLGLARSLAEGPGMTLSSGAIGSPSYMSPEQVRADPEIDFRADMYSLGATLYHMLTGHTPFKGSSNVYEVLRKQVLERLPDPRDYNPNISPGCVVLLDILMAKDRAARHPSWASLIADIDRVLANDAPAYVAGRPQLRSIRLRAAVLEGVAVLTAVAGLWYGMRQRAPSAQAPAGPETGPRSSPTPTAEHRSPAEIMNAIHTAFPDLDVGARIFTTPDGLVANMAGVSGLTDLAVLAGLPLVGLNLANTGVRDLAPLAGMSLAELDLTATAVSDLHPLKGMPLRSLTLTSCHDVTDLSPLRGMRLQKILLSETRVSDLSALAGMPIESIDFTSTQVHDIAPLKGMPLHGALSLARTGVSDIGPLEGMPLNWLTLWETHVADLRPLKGMPLRHLDLNGCSRLTDLRPLHGMPLTWLSVADTPVHDLAPLAGMPMQELILARSQVDELTPLAGMPLKTLDAGYTAISDLGPLHGAPLTQLDISQTRVTSLLPLRDVPLVNLQAPETPLASLDGLQKSRLTDLKLWRTQIADLSPLKGLPLRELDLVECPRVTDLSPLAGMRLSVLRIQSTQVTDLSPLAGMTSLVELRCEEALLRETTSAFTVALRRGDLPAANREAAQLETLFGKVPAMEATLSTVKTLLKNAQAKPAPQPANP